MSKKIFAFTVFILCLFSASAQDVTVFEKFDSLQTRWIKGDSTTLYIVNFWATWCKPCVEELPILEQANTSFSGKKVKVLLVSIDFKSQMEKRLLPFLKEKKLGSEVVLLADQKANDWIKKLDETWDGAIPATFFYKNGKSQFYGGQFPDYQAIETIINSFF